MTDATEPTVAEETITKEVQNCFVENFHAMLLDIQEISVFMPQNVHKILEKSKLVCMNILILNMKIYLSAKLHPTYFMTLFTL